MNLQVSKAMCDAVNNTTEGAFQGAGAILSESKRFVREELQAETASRIKDIINKLSDNSQISAEDIALIKLWIVGDAESYIQAENNLNDWLGEYKRLAGVLEGYENRACNTEDLFKLEGLLEDATRVSYDIANFLEKKNRINNFQLAVLDGLDKEERDILVDVLKGKLTSKEY